MVVNHMSQDLDALSFIQAIDVPMTIMMVKSGSDFCKNESSINCIMQNTFSNS